MTSDSPMINFVVRDTRFNYRAAALCINEQRLLICRAPENDYWFLPGGRVHIGETSEQAIVRELIEELGTAPESAQLIWFIESFFDIDGLDYHEIGAYFEVTLPVEAEAHTWTDGTTRIETGDRTMIEWRWLPLTKLNDVDLRPPFLKERLRSPLAGLEHVIDRPIF